MPGRNSVEVRRSISRDVGAWRIALFLLGVTPLHEFCGIRDPMMQRMQMVLFIKNIARLGAAMLITRFGSGPGSLDARQKQIVGVLLSYASDLCAARL